MALSAFGGLLEACGTVSGIGAGTGIWFRALEDPIRKNIAAIIKKHIPDYDNGSRLQDQTEEIAKSGLFEPAEFVEGNVVLRQPLEKVWKHGVRMLRS